MSGSLNRGPMAPFIVVIPVNSIATPRSISPTVLFLFFFENITMTIPATASMAERFVGFIRFIRKLSDCPTLASLSICAVMVVPILAPMMIPTAPRSFSSPALTRPMTITVVAVEDCTAAVTSAPNRILVKILPDTVASIFSISPPAAFSRPELSVFIPYMNMASPPSATKMLKKTDI